MMPGREFYKMSGSGNDFVFFDTRSLPPGPLEEPRSIRQLCARGTGVGADGVVFLERSERAAFGIRYFNADGSLASLCGNASLCSVSLAVELGIAKADGLRFDTGDGVLRGRLRESMPEIDLGGARELTPWFDASLGAGEQRIGFARVGVPHLVVLCDDTASIDVVGRGVPLRYHASLRDGANVNFVSRRDREGEGWGWLIRTYERGVEAETLACGTGAVATAALLRAWGLAGAQTRLTTRSGNELSVTLGSGPDDSSSLSGEGRIVYRGELRDLPS